MGDKDDADDFCVRICVRLSIRHMTKQDKIGYTVELKNYVLMVSYGKLRNVGSLETVSENPRVGGSIPSLGT